LGGVGDVKHTAAPSVCSRVEATEPPADFAV
jgi:hypothetical protein